jgi:hypothetical protein
MFSKFTFGRDFVKPLIIKSLIKSKRLRYFELSHNFALAFCKSRKSKSLTTMNTEITTAAELHKIDPVFGQVSFDNHEQIVFCNDKDTGLKAIIGIHNTVLGPALGGTRMWKYSNEWEALNDVLRLSRGHDLQVGDFGFEPWRRKSGYHR